MSPLYITQSEIVMKIKTKDDFLKELGYEPNQLIHSPAGLLDVLSIKKGKVTLDNLVTGQTKTFDINYYISNFKSC